MIIMKYVGRLMVAAMTAGLIGCSRAEQPTGIVAYDTLMNNRQTAQYVDYVTGEIYDDFNKNGKVDMVCMQSDDSCLVVMDRIPEFRGGEMYFGNNYQVVMRDSEEGQKLQAEFDGILTAYKLQENQKISG